MPRVENAVCRVRKLQDRAWDRVRKEERGVEQSNEGLISNRAWDREPQGRGEVVWVMLQGG